MEVLGSVAAAASLTDGTLKIIEGINQARRAQSSISSLGPMLDSTAATLYSVKAYLSQFESGHHSARDQFVSSSPLMIILNGIRDDLLSIQARRLEFSHQEPDRLKKRIQNNLRWSSGLKEVNAALVRLESYKSDLNILLKTLDGQNTFQINQVQNQILHKIQQMAIQTHTSGSPHILVPITQSSIISSSTADPQISSPLAETNRGIDQLTHQNSAILNGIIDLGKKIEDSASYSIQNGSFVSSSNLSTPNQRSFASVVRDQLLSVLPAFIEDLAEKQSRTSQQWVRNELSEIFLRATEEIASAAANSRSFLEQDTKAASEFQEGSQNFEDCSLYQPQSDHSLDSNSTATESTRISKFSKSFKSRLGAFYVTIYKYASGQTSGLYTYRFHFHPAAFFIQTGLLVSGNLSFDPRGWPLISPNISFFAIIPDDADIYQYIANGDVANIRQLFASRKISPSDRSQSSGDSYLQEALLKKRFEIVPLLLIEGVDPCAENNSDFNAIDTIFHINAIDTIFHFPSAAPLQKLQEIARLLKRKAPQINPNKYILITYVLMPLLAPLDYRSGSPTKNHFCKRFPDLHQWPWDCLAIMIRDLGFTDLRDSQGDNLYHLNTLRAMRLLFCVEDCDMCEIAWFSLWPIYMDFLRQCIPELPLSFRIGDPSIYWGEVTCSYLLPAFTSSGAHVALDALVTHATTYLKHGVAPPRLTFLNDHYHGFLFIWEPILWECSEYIGGIAANSPVRPWEDDVAGNGTTTLRRRRVYQNNLNDDAEESTGTCKARSIGFDGRGCLSTFFLWHSKSCAADCCKTSDFYFHHCHGSGPCNLPMPDLWYRYFHRECTRPRCWKRAKEERWVPWATSQNSRLSMVLYDLSLDYLSDWLERQTGSSSRELMPGTWHE